MKICKYYIQEEEMKRACTAMSTEYKEYLQFICDLGNNVARNTCDFDAEGIRRILIGIMQADHTKGSKQDREQAGSSKKWSQWAQALRDVAMHPEKYKQKVKLWTKDSSMWKVLCAKRWPSVCKNKAPPPVGSSRGYHSFFTSLCKRHRQRPLPSPRLSFDDIKFYVDIWVDDKSVYSDVIPGTALQSGIIKPPTGICDVMKIHLNSTSCKMTISCSLDEETRIKFLAL